MLTASHSNLGRALTTVLFTFIVGCAVALAQAISVKGTVLDSTGEPITGATVMVVGTKNAVTTDIDGNFTIKAKPGSVLSIRFVGCKPLNIQVKNDKPLNITLEDDSQLLNEVVVTALGITREAKSLSYARQSIDAESMTEARGANLLDMLAGKAAGMQIMSGGNPGSSTRVMIRGLSSISGNNQPLYVIDGVPVLNNDGEDGDFDYGNAINSINPDEIENIEVLKGANASALYGSDAANGVILITTKKASGSNKGLGVTYGFNMMFGKLYEYPEYQNVYGAGWCDRFGRRDQGANFYNNTGNVNGYDPSLPYYIWNPNEAGQNQRSYGLPMLGFDIVGRNGEVKSYSPHPETIKNMYQTSTMITNNVSVERKFDHGTFRFSYNNVHSDDILDNVNKIDRHTFNLRATAELAKWVDIDVNARYQHENVDNRNNRGTTERNPINAIADLPRDASVAELAPWKKADGSAFVFKDFNNPYWLLYETSNADQKDWFLGNLTLNFKLTSYLKLRGRAATDFQTSSGWNFINMYTPYDPDGEYSYWKRNWTNNNFDVLLSFNKNFVNSKLNVNANIGASYQEIKGSRIKSLVNQLQFSDIKSLSNNAGLMSSVQENEWKKKQAVFGMASVGWDDWAFLDLTARNEWSSTLPKDNNSYFYWSAGSGIILSKLLKLDPKAFPFIKIRGSYAQVGNDTGYDKLITGYTKNDQNYTFNGIPYYVREELLKTMGLRPERTRSWELGAELRFLDNRISLDATYYDKLTRDQIIEADVPFGSGYRKEMMNAGKMSNKGIELSLSVTPIRTKNFSWTSSFNWSKNENKVLKIADGVERYQVDEFAGIMYVYAVEGQPYGSIYGNVYRRDEEGHVLVSREGKPLYDSDRFIANAQPDWFGGWKNTFRIFDFDLGFAIDFQKGGNVWSYTSYQGSRNGQTIQTLDGRFEALQSWMFLGESENERRGFLDAQWTNNPAATVIYDTRYPDLDRPKGVRIEGAVYDESAGELAGQPAVAWVSPTTFWQDCCAYNMPYYVYDTSYIRLREITVGYNVPQKWVKKTHFLRSAKVSFVGRNIATLFSNMPKGMDPQASQASGNKIGFERGFSLPMATYGFDIKVTF
ncbi:MAG: SusC/RagA family TonB-linked outer membrane protein [Bacteroides sp.]|nr:SusC/RagA family TonB-linked outer membrane protein [Bacteroides sp.]MCM1095276.1 SusC/RagA family TonB-linked outer membrane protein [Terasakiella sp.]